ncbi:bacteriorhodopsin [Halonotius pteroides]|uniref:Capsular biosynthesis protein CpsH n=1 Tax=Halonotius pteroides TaxID=268735 RepID=A0A3A6Q1C2_9EURY|nr:bacteriorhodopsin [Halonotius pteroides]RJX49189.1 capsular biosynthesis protein CpsH [Halonotius pteroides]
MTALTAATPAVALTSDLTQSELFTQIAGNTSLSASFWINIALAGFAILLFVYMGRNVSDSRAQLIFVATMMVPLVSISSYTGLVSGLSVGMISVPYPGGGSEEVLIMWGRYLTWALSTPMILIALGLLAGTNLTKLFTVVVMDIGMCVTGLAAALTTSSLLLRWFWYLLSCAFFVAVIYILLVEWPTDAREAGTAEIFSTLKTLTVTLWLGYPIFWALGSEGLAILTTTQTSWAYSLLDVGAKYIFAFLLLRWVVANQNVVGNIAGGSLGSVSSAD